MCWPRACPCTCSLVCHPFDRLAAGRLRSFTWATMYSSAVRLMYAHCIRVFRLSVICDYTLSAILQMMCYITNSAILQMMLEHLIAVLSWVEIKAMCLQRSRCLLTVLCDVTLIARLHISGAGGAALIAMLCYARYRHC